MMGRSSEQEESGGDPEPSQDDSPPGGQEIEMMQMEEEPSRRIGVQSRLTKAELEGAWWNDGPRRRQGR